MIIFNQRRDEIINLDNLTDISYSILLDDDDETGGSIGDYIIDAHINNIVASEKNKKVVNISRTAIPLGVYKKEKIAKKVLEELLEDYANNKKIYIMPDKNGCPFIIV
jgi:hypothetical protein